MEKPYGRRTGTATSGSGWAACIAPVLIFNMFKREAKTFIALQCQTCGSIASDWELDLFKGSYLDREYRANGAVPQQCGCDGPVDTLHKIVGVVEERQIPLKERAVLKKMEKKNGQSQESDPQTS